MSIDESSVDQVSERFECGDSADTIIDLCPLGIIAQVLLHDRIISIKT